VHCSGPGSIVRRCLHKQTGAQFSVKVVDVSSSDVAAEGYLLLSLLLSVSVSTCIAVRDRACWPHLFGLSVCGIMEKIRNLCTSFASKRSMFGKNSCINCARMIDQRAILLLTI